MILGGLGPNFGAPVFITVHVGADGYDRIAGILNDSSAIKVTTAADGVTAERGCAYVAPANHHLVVMDDVIRLGRGPRENLSRPAIDPLFRSLGFHYGCGAIGVLLSGYLNDGAAGLSDLKRCGGVSIVQNPADASVSDMPQAALRASDVDYRANAAQIPELLEGLISSSPKPHEAAASPPDVLIEIEIALGREVGAAVVAKIAEPVPLSCPSCSGVLSQSRQPSPLRFRCQVGHGFTGEILEAEQGTATDEALRVALRIIGERETLIEKLVLEAESSGRVSAAASYAKRLGECQSAAETLKCALSLRWS